MIYYEVLWSIFSGRIFVRVCVCVCVSVSKNEHTSHSDLGF